MSKQTTNHRHAYNYKHTDKDFEGVVAGSMAMPNQAYSIKEILDRFARGMMPPIQKQGIYANDPTFDDVDPTRDPAFDLADVTERTEEIDNLLTELEKKKKELAELKRKEKEAKNNPPPPPPQDEK